MPGLWLRPAASTFQLIPITPMVDAYFDSFPDADNMRRGNKMARERMTILFDHSALLAALVLGTSNKTELLLGYGTLYGDMASALNPIGDLYKSQVWQLAAEMGVPRAVIDKKPSADLWAGQTDEQELGFTYREVDELLYRMIDLRMTREELLAEGFKAEFIEEIREGSRTPTSNGGCRSSPRFPTEPSTGISGIHVTGANNSAGEETAPASGKGHENAGVGTSGEELAAAFLQRSGLKIIERNFRCKGGEVDIVAKDGDTFVFVEVKTRKTLTYGPPQLAVTPFKQRQISKAALTWLARNRLHDHPARFDVIAIILESSYRHQLEHISNAFELAY